MKASICMSSFKRSPSTLVAVLRSIMSQSPSFDYEVIVVDDGSPGDTTRIICEQFPVTYHRVEREPIRRNPCIARNIAYLAARGEYLILQSDDVEHVTRDSVEKLVGEATNHPKSFILANVLACGPDGVPWSEYVGPTRQLPLFFLGAVRRSHVCAIGGNDEEFVNTPGYEDQWFSDCLIHGQGLSPRFITSVVGHHLYHPRSDTDSDATAAEAIYNSKRQNAKARGEWFSSGGKWECTQ